MMKKLFIFVAISGCFSVLFGAWLAHGGQNLPLDIRVRLANALQYQFIHTLVLFSTLILHILLPKERRSKWLSFSALCFCLGILFFSGSLYLKTFFEFSLVGKLAPIGGITLALGWFFLSIAANKLYSAKNR